MHGCTSIPEVLCCDPLLCGITVPVVLPGQHSQEDLQAVRARLPEYITCQTFSTLLSQNSK